jgi:ribosomal protein L14
MQKGSFLHTADNSGISWVRLIHRYNTTKFLTLGELVLLSCRTVNIKKKWIKGQKVKGIIIHIKRPIYRTTFAIKCEKNEVIILKDNLDIKATRIKGIIFEEFRHTNFKKLLTLGDYVL